MAADIKISQMTKATILTGGELIPIVQNGSNKVTDITLLTKDLATQDWVQALINTTGGRVVVVTVLPTKGDANKIYLVPNGSSKANDVYDEYVWLGDIDGWEFLGNKHVAVDLTPYYTKTEVDDKFVIGITGKGLSTNDFTTAQKTKLDEGYTKAQIDTLIAALNTRITALETTP